MNAGKLMKNMLANDGNTHLLLITGFPQKTYSEQNIYIPKKTGVICNKDNENIYA
jgi:hypothetical protein